MSFLIKGSQSLPFDLKQARKQGNVFTTLLFAEFACNNSRFYLFRHRTWLCLEYKITGGIVCQLYFKVMAKVLSETIRDLLFADYFTLTAHTLRHPAHHWQIWSIYLGLSISIKKSTELRPSKKIWPSVFMEGKSMKTVVAFIYLGSTVWSDAKLKMEVERNSHWKSQNHFRELLWSTLKVLGVSGRTKKLCVYSQLL